MKSSPDLSLIIPAYNEARRIEATVRSAVAHFRSTGPAIEILVVDDGSRDETSRIVQQLGEELAEVQLIRLPANRGKGFAVRTGVANARGARILFADADGATPFPEVERLNAAMSAGADIAIGSRAHQAADVRVTARLHRRLMGGIFRGLVRSVAIRGFHDTQCGFKLFRAGAAHDVFSRMRMNGFSFDVEILLIAQVQGFRVTEVPVNWTHQAGSRVNLVLDSARMGMDLLAIRGNLVRGRYGHPHVAPNFVRSPAPLPVFDRSSAVVLGG